MTKPLEIEKKIDPQCIANALSIWFLIVLVGQPVCSFAQSTDMEKIRQRMIKDAVADKSFLPRINRYTDCDFDKAEHYLAELDLIGSWSDINYHDEDNKWDPLYALDRVLVMAFAYRNPKNELQLNGELLIGIRHALAYWYKINPRCNNWYKNEIAKQMYFSVIALLMQDHLEENLMQKMIHDLTEAPRMTGSNRTLLSVAVFVRGVLEKDSTRLLSGVQGAPDQITLGGSEGIQYDFSFHQHGAFIYNGNYGHNFLRETLWVASMVRNSVYAFKEDHISILRSYYLQGTRWMIWRDLLDYNVRGRQVGRSHSFGREGESQIPILNNLTAIDTQFADRYQLSKQRIIDRLPQNLSGHKHYWHSDYSVHQHEKYFTSLRMCSKRTVGMEMDVNGENMYGYYLPFGLTYIYRRGDEYQDIFPVWDWGRLPGVTSPHRAFSTSGKSGQTTAFVGGIASQQTGVSVMHLDVQETTAKKGWFWFDDVWIALGTDIASTAEEEIVTGINQTRLNGPVLVNGAPFSGEEQKFDSVRWVWHDSVAYIFPVLQNISLTAKTQQGQLQDIYKLGADSVYKIDVFSLWNNHGIKPIDESYAYIVKPGCDPSETAEWLKINPVSIIANNNQIQAVTHDDLGVTGIIFHEPGTIAINDSLSFEVNTSCLLMYNHEKEHISVSDPTMELQTVQISKHNADRPTIKKLITFPQPDLVRGAPVVFSIKE